MKNSVVSSKKISWSTVKSRLEILRLLAAAAAAFSFPFVCVIPCVDGRRVLMTSSCQKQLRNEKNKNKYNKLEKKKLLIPAGVSTTQKSINSPLHHTHTHTNTKIKTKTRQVKNNDTPIY